MTPLAVADAFVAAINAGEADGLASLMTPGHMFVDADGSEHVGRDKMKAGWREYFESVPDFQIEISDRLETKNTVVLLGRASGTFVQDGELKPDNHWSVPAAWRVVVDRDLVAVWQLYANQHLMHQIMDRIRVA
ncbi:MAG: nuclear transport factor 2 family protein [Gemmatimonadota bacterium]|nr:nuclear transport factor 2 family protein [Gemmatimonadota bacterium]MDH3479959.1 nuclear transport factor 2 family protein [Gemmatimonadota bacterium]MDH3570317.1 nuclear transport factor 2 family protein [Gemmatimonadota bacterium]MDH5551278.1 nuclear transport factor 2 family protein [Gemmatimonadota bacterium]